MHRREIGRRGEDLAAAWLTERGWRVIDRNWRCRNGEIDLVAWDGPALVVVEVKTRTGSGTGHPAEAVTPVKLARLRRLAGHWLSAHDLRASEVRVDVLAVLARPDRPPTLELLAGES